MPTNKLAFVTGIALLAAVSLAEGTAIDIRAVWKHKGSEVVATTSRCLNERTVKLTFGLGTNALGLEMTPKLRGAPSSLVTLTWHGKHVSTLVGSDANLSFAKGPEGLVLRVETGDRHRATDLKLGEGWSDLAGASLTLAGKLVPAS